MGGGDAEPELIQRAVNALQRSGGIRAAPCRIGESGAGSVASAGFPVGPEQIELELRGHYGGQAEGFNIRYGAP
jgi:hypothetical protein